MRHLSKAAFFLVAVAFSSASRADTAADLALCVDWNAPADRRVEACTRVIANSQDAHDVFRAYANRAQAHFLNGRGDQAIPDISYAIELEPDNAAGYSIRGGMYYSYDDYDKAIADLSVFLEQYPDDVGTLSMRAFAYYALDEHDLSISDYDAVIRANPEDAYAFYLRGMNHDAKGDFTRARADFESAIHLDRSYAGEFPAACFGVDLFSDEPRRELTNWPACEQDD